MIKATWNGKVLAESDDTHVVEGNHYFPVDSLRKEYFRKSDLTTRCAWKGTASYFDLVVEGEENPAAAWYYADPSESAKAIRGRVAFWKGVRVAP